MVQDGKRSAAENEANDIFGTIETSRFIRWQQYVEQDSELLVGICPWDC